MSFQKPTKNRKALSIIQTNKTLAEYPEPVEVCPLFLEMKEAIEAWAKDNDVIADTDEVVFDEHTGEFFVVIQDWMVIAGNSAKVSSRIGLNPLSSEDAMMAWAERIHDFRAACFNSFAVEA